jgi:arylsulfatase A-like enzyme
MLDKNQERMVEIIKQYGFDSVSNVYFGNLEQLLCRAMVFHNMEWVTKGALDFIEQNKDHSFFLHVATTLHHAPNPGESLLADPRVTGAGISDEPLDVMPPRGTIPARLQKAGLSPNSAACTWLDDGIGAILNKLETLGLADDTAIFLFSDHNPEAKATLYEGGVRTPFLMRWKKGIAPGQTCNALVQNIDIVPTILDICGVSEAAGMDVDGTSILPVLRGQEETTHDDLFFEIGWSRAVRTERYKYIAVRVPRDYSVKIPQGTPRPEELRRPWHVGVCVPYQVRASKRYPGYWDVDQLYDLKKDPGEQNNLAGDPEYGDILGVMKRRLIAHLQRFPNRFGELYDGGG